jgi:hypothetical protein
MTGQRIVSIENTHTTSNGTFHVLVVVPLPRDLFTQAWHLLKSHRGFFLKETKRWYCPVDTWDDYSESLRELSLRLDAEEGLSEVGLSGVARELYEAQKAGSND